MDLNEIKQRTQDNEDDLIILNENELNSDTKRANYKSYTERYFTKYYKLNVRHPNNDHMILMHSNRIAVCCLAPSHPVLDKSKYKIEKVEYLQDVADEMSGKHKHNAKNVNINQPLCKLYAKNLHPTDNELADRYFLICANLNAKLLEINEKLVIQPDLIQNKPFTEGFVAILMPKLETLNEQLKELIPDDEYNKMDLKKFN